MSGETDVGVNIRADASGVETGAKQAQNAMSGLGASIKDVADQMKATSSAIVVASNGMGQSMSQAMTGAVETSRAAKAAYVNLGRQMQDVAVMASMPGINIGTIITTQGGQIADAVSQMGNRFSGFASFLAGPWGAAVIVATGMLATFAQKMFESGDAASKAKNQHETLAEKLNYQKHAWQEVIAAMQDYNREAKKAAQSAYDVAQATYKQAQADLDAALAIRRKLAAQLESNRQSMTGLQSQGQGGLGGALGQMSIQSEMAENAKAVVELINGVKTAGGSLAQEMAKIATDPKYAIEQRYEKMRNAIKAAGGDVDSMAAKLAEVNRQENAALDKLKKDKQKPKDTSFRDADTDLQLLKSGWQKEAQAHDDHLGYMLKAERDYWAAQLKQAGLSEKAKADMSAKLRQAETAIAQNEAAKAAERLKLEEAQFGENQAAKLRLLQKAQADASLLYGAASKEAIAAQTAVVAQQELMNRKSVELVKERIAAEAAARTAEIDAKRATAEFEVQMGRMTNQQLIQLERQFLAEKYAVQKGQLEAQKGALDPSKDVEKIQQLNNQLLELDRKFQADKTQLERKGELERTAIQRSSIQQMSSSFAQSLSRMATLQLSFAQGMQSLWRGLLNVISGAIEQMISQWLAKQLLALGIGRAQQAITGVAQVTSNAAVAGSAAFASTAAIPIIGPALAPGAAAAATGAVMAFAPMASARGGWGDVPFDGAMTELHKNEMVLPADIATPLRQQLKGGSGASPAFTPPAASNDQAASGDTYHVTFQSMFPPSPSQMRQWAQQNNGLFGAGMKQYFRNGGR